MAKSSSLLPRSRPTSARLVTAPQLQVIRTIVETANDLHLSRAVTVYLLGVARAESGFRPDAINPTSRAFGLFQMLPRYLTARDRASIPAQITRYLHLAFIEPGSYARVLAAPKHRRWRTNATMTRLIHQASESGLRPPFGAIAVCHRFGLGNALKPGYDVSDLGPWLARANFPLVSTLIN